MPVSTDVLVAFSVSESSMLFKYRRHDCCNYSLTAVRLAVPVRQLLEPVKQPRSLIPEEVVMLFIYNEIIQ